jgi:hypothetical protein
LHIFTSPSKTYEERCCVCLEYVFLFHACFFLPFILNIKWQCAVIFSNINWKSGKKNDFQL